MSHTDSAAASADEVTELLRALIQNACVNDGTVHSGNESRSVATLLDYFDRDGGLDTPGVEYATFSAIENRASLVVRVKGTDPAAPTMMLMGHTDVVPANASNWTYPPFDAVCDGTRIWGRGAIDMLNLTAAMAVATKHVARCGGARGDVVYFAVADEETGGVYGAKYGLEHHADLLRTDVVFSETGGYSLFDGANGAPNLALVVGEKGFGRWKLIVRGTSGHASMPYGAENALSRAARVLQRLEEFERTNTRLVLDDVWCSLYETMHVATKAGKLDVPPFAAEKEKLEENGAIALDEWLASVPHGLAKRLHATSRLTVTPTTIMGGKSANVIPDVVEIGLDIRSVPGQNAEDVVVYLRDACEDFGEHVEICADALDPATTSPSAHHFVDAIARQSAALIPGAKCVPVRTSGGSDAFYFRQRGIPCYGTGLFSNALNGEMYYPLIHGVDEWVDQESLVLSTKFFMGLPFALHEESSVQ